MTNDLQDFEKVITHSTSDLIKTVVLSVYLLIITFFIDVKLAIIQLAFVLVAMPIILMGGKRVTAIGKQKRKL